MSLRNEERLTGEQQKFLRVCRDDYNALKEMTEKFRHKPWLLSKWLRRKHFRQALAEVLREMRRHKELEFELSARHATHVLGRMLTVGEGNHLVRQSAFDILDLYFSRKHPGRKVIKPQPPKAKMPDSPVHPDVGAAEEKELLAELQADDEQEDEHVS